MDRLNQNLKHFKFYKIRRPLDSRDVTALCCPFCKQPLQNPVQVITCGHRYCSHCMEFIKYTNIQDKAFRCPLDNQIFQKDEVCKDRACQKELKEYDVECINCKWRGSITESSIHTDNCPKKVGLKTSVVNTPHTTPIRKSHSRPRSAPPMNMSRPKYQTTVSNTDKVEMVDYEALLKHLVLSNRRLMSDLEKISMEQTLQDDSTTTHQLLTEPEFEPVATTYSTQGQKPMSHSDTKSAMVVGRVMSAHPLHLNWEKKTQSVAERSSLIQWRIDSMQPMIGL